MIINWDCNLDYSEEDCLPKYSFRRLDRGDYSISRGFNFRSAGLLGWGGEGRGDNYAQCFVCLFACAFHCSDEEGE